MAGRQSGEGDSESLLKGRVIVLTGASRGIGRAAALALAQAGGRLVAVSRDTEALKTLQSELDGIAKGSITIKADVTRRDAVRGVVAEARSRVGPIEALITNAGGYSAAASLEEIDDAMFDHLIDINMKATLYCIQEVLPDMKSAGYGKIVTIASGGGVVGSRSAPHYAATKGAVISLTRSAALYLAPFGIRVNCINPSAGSDMFDEFFSHLSPEEQRLHMARFPLGVPTAEQVAGAYVFLCSSLSDAMTAQTVNADGGYVVH